MDRKRLSPDKLRVWAAKYKYAVAVVLLGVLLMLLPTGGKRGAQTVSPPADADSRAAVEREMEEVLAAFEGVGRLKLMLTTAPGTERWAGAVVVCEGGGSAAARLELTRAVSALTGLPSDKIAIVKGKP